VHRDVSPENLLVTYAGVTKVVDFGLASASKQTHRTRTGIIKGKFGYVSPEGLRGGKVDRRADVWSMGVVVWELLTGRRLFRGDSDLATLNAVAEARIPPPSDVRAGLSKELDAPVLRALSRDPAQRQSTAKEFADELLKAVPKAARASEQDVAQWLSELFPNGRRWKAQVIELVERLSSPDLAALDADQDDALTLVRTPTSKRGHAAPNQSRPSLVRRVSAVVRQRPRLLAVLAAPALLLACAALTHPFANPKRSVSSEVALAAVSRSAPADRTATPVPAAAPISEALEPMTPLNVVELPEGNGYLLEIAQPGAAAKTLVLRLRPESRRAQPAPHSAVPAPRKALPAREDGSPPAWLRTVMEQENQPRPLAFASQVGEAFGRARELRSQ
jgi:hypothetical protein